MFVGQTFTPYNTDSVGTVLGIANDREHTVTFSYAHNPERTFTGPMKWLMSISR